MAHTPTNCTATYFFVKNAQRRRSTDVSIQYAASRLLAVLLLACCDVLMGASLEQLNSCLKGSESTSLQSCAAYIDSGGTDIRAYLHLGGLYKEKGEFEKSKDVYERALLIRETTILTARAKTADSLVEEEAWIKNNTGNDSTKSSDESSRAIRTDRIKCIRLSSINPKLAHEACTRYMDATGTIDQDVKQANELAWASLGFAPQTGTAASSDVPIKRDDDIESTTTIAVEQQGTETQGPALITVSTSNGDASAELAELREQIAALSKLITARAAKTAPPSAVYSERGKRKALVIGNWDYPTNIGKLFNPENDAKQISSALHTMNFEVTTVYNGSLRDMETAVSDFSRSIKPADVALFYYAGHGVQIQGTNYLIPTGIGIEDAIDIRYKSVDLSYIMEKMNRQNTGLTIVILDACRNNPFTSDRGLAQAGWAVTKGPVGSIIAYATAPGDVAMDGTGNNGLYTKHLLRLMKEPSLKIEDMFKKVRIAVENESDGTQIPWENSSLKGDFYFVVPSS
jgi:hypothetical protein